MSAILSNHIIRIDAMTPKEAIAELAVVAREISDKCEFTVFLSFSEYREKALYAIVKAQGGYPAPNTFDVEADTFEDMIAGIRSKWSAHAEEYARKTTNDMALEIIRITDAFGECPDAALRGDKFTRSDVAKFGAAACGRAAEMASKGPFSIVSMAGANGIAA